MPFSIMELLLILVLFIVLIGPKELPSVLKQLIKAYRLYQQWLGRLSEDVQGVVSSIEKSTHRVTASDGASKATDDSTGVGDATSTQQPQVSAEPKLRQEDMV